MAIFVSPEVKKLLSFDIVITTIIITNFRHNKESTIVLNDILITNRNLICVAGELDNCDLSDYLEDSRMNLHGHVHIIHRKLCIYSL